MRKALLLLAALAVAGCVNQATRLRVDDVAYRPAAIAADPVHARLTAFFDEAAFGNDDVFLTKKVRSFQRVVKRWKLPLRVTAGGAVTVEKERLIRDRLERFRELTGVDLHWEGLDAKRYNFKIVVVPSSQIRARASSDTLCVANPDDSNGTILSATLHLPAGDLKDFEECLDHELMHAFGFDGHSHRLESTLSYMHNKGALTTWDEILLRTLYSPQLTPGMHRQAALPVVSRLLAEELEKLRAAGALPDLGDEYWAVFADEIPFSIMADGLPPLPRLSVARGDGKGDAVETRAVFAPADGDPRAEVILSNGSSLRERWAMLDERWKKVSRGKSLTATPYDGAGADWTGLHDTVRHSGRACLVFVRDTDRPGHYLSGYYCRAGSINPGLRDRILGGLSLHPPQAPES